MQFGVRVLVPPRPLYFGIKREIPHGINTILSPMPYKMAKDF
jgi:hypothetical protein